MSEDRHAAFRALHRPGEPFVLANVWDAGSAQVMAALGAKALATSSAAHAFTLGRPDGGGVSRDEALAHAQDLVAATPLPVSGDFENGFGEAPETVAETVRLAAEAGLSGCSIEDIALPAQTAYDRALAVERIRAGVAAARSLGRDFVFLARADGVMTGAYDLDEAIARIQAFEAAGADCVYVPVPGDRAALARVLSSVGAPVNALAVGPLSKLSLAEFGAMGVARVSLGSALARMVHKTLIDAGEAMLVEGRFDSHLGAPGDAVDALLAKGEG